MTPRRRDVLLRLLRSLAVAMVLLAPWPGLGRAYVTAFGGVATTVARPFLAGKGVLVSFSPAIAAARHREWSLMIRVDDAATMAPKHLGAVDLRRAGYLQIAFFLIAASAFPLVGGRRLVAALVGGVVLLSTLGCLPVLTYLAVKHVFDPGAVAFSVLAVLQRSLAGAPGMAVFVPCLLWLVVFRIEHGRGAAGASPSAAVAPS